jgi:N-acetylneuraminic acid mutarotase
MKKILILLFAIAIVLVLTNCKKKVDQFPIVDAGRDQSVTLPTDSIQLTGKGRDADGNIASLRYEWKKISGPGSANIVQPYNAITMVRNLTEGLYEFELKVTSEPGLAATDNIIITVLPAPPPPYPNSIGSLSVPRWGAVAAAAGSKVLFAGGSYGEVNPSVFSRVDIYDTSTHSWSTAELSEPRVGIGAVTVGNKILFAGGAKNFDYNIGWYDLTTKVDIYDATTNTWTTSELPGEQLFLWGFGVASGTGNKAYFYSYYRGGQIYVYDVAINTWSILTINGPHRHDLAVATIASKVFFAGGAASSIGYLDRVDIFNESTNGWTLNSLSEPRTVIKATNVRNKVLFAGGQMPAGNHKSKVDIYDNASQTWSVANLSRPAVLAGAVTTGQKALFFEGTVVDVYNAASDTWSVANIDMSIVFDASVIIASGNSVYISGAKINNAWINQVWKLEF